MSDQSIVAAFYDAAYRGDGYATFYSAREHFAVMELQQFVDKFELVGKKCLEVGSGRGAFQDIVPDYTGLDLSAAVATNYHKPFVTASAEELPFEDCSFDAVWSITVLEHIPDPNKALLEMRRVLKDNGLLFLKPAWNCRPWICEGIPVRPYASLSWRQKWIKLTLPIRDSLALRALRTLPGRFWNSVIQRGTSLRFSRLQADYQTFWMVDSDACSSIDPFDAIQWFQLSGDMVLSHPTWLSAFLSRSEHLIVRIRKPPSDGFSASPR